MPKLSDSMADAVILRWLKEPGETFKRGEGLIEVETDKATVVYEAEHDGTLASILVPEGQAAAVGEAIATLGNGDAAPRRSERAEPTPAVAAPRRPVGPPLSGDGDGAARPNATPVARRVAVELGISLRGLAGTGPGGRITREDV
ncbi:MAG: E3 binding domain-containing protein, partial [Thermoleophilia bacterium]|nr:E3 binding domain-containing protein [Thermoleophilia bacterium]